MSPGILVATDFSDGSILALAEGRRLSRTMGVRLHMAHVSESGTGQGTESDAPQESGWLQDADVAPEELVRRTGVAAVELARLARELDAAMIVLGTHGSSGYQPVALGATASRLALLAPCPVVLVGPRGRLRTGGTGSPEKRQHGIGSGDPFSEPSDPAISGIVPETQE